MKEICRQTLQQVYLFLDGEVLSASERTQIETHLQACRPCYERYGLQEEITAMIVRLRGAQRCPDHLRSRIVSLLHDL